MHFLFYSFLAYVFFYLSILFYCMTMFICEALWVCLVYEKCYINKVALPCLAYNRVIWTLIYWVFLYIGPLSLGEKRGQNCSRLSCPLVGKQTADWGLRGTGGLEGRLDTLSLPCCFTYLHVPSFHFTSNLILDLTSDGLLVLQLI